MEGEPEKQRIHHGKKAVQDPYGLVYFLRGELD